MYPTRRFVDADNSCLFSSIAYLLDDKFDENSKLKYRQLLINYLENIEIDIATLGTTKEDYINEMININTWGGAIELKLFSELFQTEIVSFDIQFNRADIFGQEKNYIHRIFVLYNGVHYDPLVMATTEDTKDDVKIFDTCDDNILINFKAYANNLKINGEYVDLSNSLNLKCSNCGNICQSQEDAADHGVNYNHWNFEEMK
tara:strand:+ start:3209 stop:3814 length:606 start_codon:yes stop_codon:yes gene_type:complete